MGYYTQWEEDEDAKKTCKIVSFINLQSASIDKRLLKTHLSFTCHKHYYKIHLVGRVENKYEKPGEIALRIHTAVQVLYPDVYLPSHISISIDHIYNDDEMK